MYTERVTIYRMEHDFRFVLVQNGKMGYNGKLFHCVRVFGFEYRTTKNDMYPLPLPYAHMYALI